MICIEPEYSRFPRRIAQGLEQMHQRLEDTDGNEILSENSISNAVQSEVNKMRSAVSRCVLLLLSCLLIVSVAGCAKDPDRIAGEAQIKIERPLAKQRLSAYLLDKYGLTESDYTVIRNKPYMRGDAGIMIILDGHSVDGVSSYYSGFWQARVRIDGVDEYDNYSVSEPYFGYDTVQADEYYAALQSWLYDNLSVPESYSIGITIDDSNHLSVETLYPAKNLIGSWGALFTGDYDGHRSLSGYYDESNIFSPISNRLFISIFGKESEPGQWASNIDYERLFHQAIAKDITVLINYRGQISNRDEWLWYRISPSDTDYSYLSQTDPIP
jgi:hypothetical protein